MAVNVEQGWDWTTIVMWALASVTTALSALVGYFYNQKPGREEVLDMIDAKLEELKTDRERQHQENLARLKDIDNELKKIPEKMAQQIRDFFAFTRGKII